MYITEDTIQAAEHLTSLVRAAASVEEIAQNEELHIKTGRLQCLINISIGIIEAAEKELDLWRSLEA